MPAPKSAAPELRTLPDLAEEIRQWKNYHYFWLTVYYILGVCAPLLSLTLAIQPDFLDFDRDTWETLSWVSVVMVFLLAFLNPMSKAKSWQGALNKLLPAYREYYDFKEKTNSPRDLMQAYKEAREIAALTD